jgi:Zn-finger nucleic acid-binding protein
MSSCPFCYGTLLPTFTHGLPREKCGRCAALWFEGEGLETVMGTAATHALLAQAKGKHGECKDCDTPLTAKEPRCPECGRDAPSCPKCGIAPLAVTRIRGVEVDVCVRCHGMALDTGELEQLLERAGDAPQRPAPAPTRAAPVRKQDKARCASCERALKLEHAFSSGGKLYCGSCAPADASPYDAESAPHAAQDDGRSAASTDPVSRALGWLFSHVNG